MKIAVAQIRSTANPWENLLQVFSLIDDAIQEGCELICFPENVFYRGPLSKKSIELQDSIFLKKSSEDGSGTVLYQEFYRFIKTRNISVSLGSVREWCESSGLFYNTHVFYHCDDKHFYTYRKKHLFCFKGKNAIDESSYFGTGEEVQCVAFRSFNFGLSICYDLRFPELFRYQTLKLNADVLLIPSAFFQVTGELHWHPMLKTRAVENLAYVAAAAQHGEHFSSTAKQYSCYGHSLLFGPWGEIIAEAPEKGDCLLLATLDRQHIDEKRRLFPALTRAGLKITL